MSEQLQPEFVSIHVERVDNGWVVRGFSWNHDRHHGYLPDGTMVARTPDQLSQILHAWASAQQDNPPSKKG